VSPSITNARLGNSRGEMVQWPNGAVVIFEFGADENGNSHTKIWERE